MNHSDPSRSNSLLPYRAYLFIAGTLLCMGLLTITYLFYSHYQNYTNITYSSFCALSKAINCDTVSQSKWSIFWGLPLALWGIISYVLYGVIFIQTVRDQQEAKTLWYVLFALALCYSLFSIYLGYVSATRIGAYCILCFACYTINFLLLLISYLIINRFQNRGLIAGIKTGLVYAAQSKLTIIGITVIFLGTIFLRSAMPAYWLFDHPLQTDLVETGLTADGHPWIGASDPQLIIHEYSDYQCFQCGKMHAFLRRLVAKYPDKLQLVHHNYPMDHEFNDIIVAEPFHIGSGKMAMLAIYAALNNKFWQMNDALYELGRNKEPFNTRVLAEMTGFTARELAHAARDQLIRAQLAHEIRQGLKLYINGTPTYVIDEVVYQGTIPLEILEKIDS